MRSFYKLFNFYLNSSLHVSLSVCCLTKITLYKYGIKDNYIPFYVFLATLISYNFIRHNTSIRNKKNSLKENNVFNVLRIMNICSAVVLCYLSFSLNKSAILVLIPVLMITFFYITPLSYKSGSLREVASLKIFLIGISWAVSTVLFPLLQYGLILDIEAWVLFFQRFLFVIAITLPFDLRDILTDHTNLKTIPQVFGVQKTKYFGTAILLVFVLLINFTVLTYAYEILITILIAIVALLFLWFSNKRQPKYYSSFWVESIPIFWWILLLIY